MVFEPISVAAKPRATEAAALKNEPPALADLALMHGGCDCPAVGGRRAGAGADAPDLGVSGDETYENLIKTSEIDVIGSDRAFTRFGRQIGTDFVYPNFARVSQLRNGARPATRGRMDNPATTTLCLVDGT